MGMPAGGVGKALSGRADKPAEGALMSKKYFSQSDYTVCKV